jgi:GR25 family glycosyltransferase involved in LPS biosynthesis
MILSDVFDGLFIIHLPELTSRKEQFKKEFSSIGISQYTIIEGVKYNGGKTVNDRIIGCKLSHIECLKKAIELNCKRPLFMEDDVIFNKNINSYLPNIKNFLDTTHWDMFYLGGNLKDKISVYENIYKTTNILTTHCFSVHKEILKDLLSIKLSNKYPLSYNDDLINVEYQKKGNSYVHIPRLAYQSDGKSYIRQATRNYMHLYKD